MRSAYQMACRHREILKWVAEKELPTKFVETRILHQLENGIHFLVTPISNCMDTSPIPEHPPSRPLWLPLSPPAFISHTRSISLCINFRSNITEGISLLESFSASMRICVTNILAHIGMHANTDGKRLIRSYISNARHFMLAPCTVLLLIWQKIKIRKYAVMLYRIYKKRIRKREKKSCQ